MPGGVAVPGIIRPKSEKTLSPLQGKLPEISLLAREAEGPICPSHEVPIERAIAEICSFPRTGQCLHCSDAGISSSVDIDLSAVTY